MKVNIQVEIPDSVILMYIKRKGHKLIKHDFGAFRTAYHNRPVWNEDIRPGVMIDGVVYAPKEAFEKLYAFELKKGVLKTLNQTI